MTTVTAIIVGDEILSGKVRDTNGPLVIAEMGRIGVSLRAISYIGDDPEVIADEVGRAMAASDVVITSGGLGPTHDDRTVVGVAQAAGVPVARHPELEEMVVNYWGDRITEAALRSAEAPQGARLLHGDGPYPVVVWGNVYLLPGIPQLFARMLSTVGQELSGEPVELRSVYLKSDETTIAADLARVDQEHPAVKIGSYPRWDESDHRVWVTFEGPDRDAVERALEHLLGLLPTGDLVRVG